MKRPTLSVIMPNYNHGHLIGRALNAIVSQSRQPDEFVIVDDASTDASLGVIASYVKECPYIHLIRNEENRGTLAAGEQAIARTTCDFVYAAAADDVVLPEAFESAMTAASEHPAVGLVFGPMQIVGSDGSYIRTQEIRSWRSDRYVDPDTFLREYLEVEAPHHSLSAATFYRREAFERIGFYRRELGYWADNFAVRALGLMHGAAYVCKPLAKWTYAEATLSGSGRRNPHLTLDLIARMVQLMRSEPFRAYFPEDYVESWATRYRSEHIRFCGKMLKRELKKRLEQLAGGPPPLPVRLLGEPVLGLVSLAARLSLMRYRADLGDPRAASGASERSPSSGPASG
jgi:glycosyltransferase involved in cell wall biosynthesis